MGNRLEAKEESKAKRTGTVITSDLASITSDLVL